jgi:hypothetical protein
MYWVYDWLNKAFVAGYNRIKAGHRAALARVKEKHKDNYWQCMVTMKLTHKKQCYLLYKDRSTGTLGLHNPETGERMGVYVKFDPEIYEEILQRWAYVKTCLDQKTPPAPEFSAGSKECAYCDFRYLCHDAEDRRARGKKPVIKYPGPQMEIHLEDHPDEGLGIAESDESDYAADTQDEG